MAPRGGVLSFTTAFYMHPKCLFFQSENEDEKMLAIHEWCGIVEEILSILLRVFPTELRDTYLTTVIEQVRVGLILG